MGGGENQKQDKELKPNITIESPCWSQLLWSELSLGPLLYPSNKNRYTCFLYLKPQTVSILLHKSEITRKKPKTVPYQNKPLGKLVLLCSRFSEQSLPIPQCIPQYTGPLEEAKYLHNYKPMKYTEDSGQRMLAPVEPQAYTTNARCTGHCNYII